jgi:PTH1 family peptidyl-tRNA hydrolase
MKLIFGLGNPEPEYTNTRHNVGKDVLNEYVNEKFPEPKWKNKPEWFAEYIELSNQALAVKPLAYMNDSGSAISRVSNYYKSETKDILILYDDLDLVVGKYKLVRAKGSRIHNGIISINQNLDSEDFWHLRIGVREELISASVQKSGRDPSKYVLSQFSSADRKKILNMTESSLITEINNWLSIN